MSVLAHANVITKFLTRTGRRYMQTALTTQTCYLLDSKRMQELAAQRTADGATNLTTTNIAVLGNFLKNILKGSK